MDVLGVVVYAGAALCLALLAVRWAREAAVPEPGPGAAGPGRPEA